MKKLICALLAIVMLLGLCACGKKEPELTPKYDEDGKVVLTIGVRTMAKINSFEDNALTKWLEEETGYSLKFVEFAGGGDAATQITTSVAGNMELPDMFWGIKLEDNLETFGKDGYFLDLKPYLDDKEGKAKNFWDRLDECLTEGQKAYVLGQIASPNSGAIYAVPTVETSLVDGLHYMTWINTEWLDKLSLDIPTNNQELYDVLVAFRDQDPNDNGLKDEIPLFGSENSMGPAQAIEMLINTFMYYNPSHLWQDYDGDGDLDHAAVQDSYREALKFVNKLYTEGLLTSMVYTVESDEMQQINTPADGVAKVGMFCGHLATDVTTDNELLYKYQAVKPWGTVCERDLGLSKRSIITETAKRRDVVEEAFNLIMLMWSWEGSMRIRYGEYGVNWTDPDAGSESFYGLPATYKLIHDGMADQGAQTWGQAHGSLNHYCEGETAQANDGASEWEVKKVQMLAEYRKLYDEAMKTTNATVMPDPYLQAFVLSDKELDEFGTTETNVNAWIDEHEMKFVCSEDGKDINDDADWKAYIDGLNDLGYENLQKLYETIRARQEK